VLLNTFVVEALLKVLNVESAGKAKFVDVVPAFSLKFLVACFL
jgi:hypothetical protein